MGEVRQEAHFKQWIGEWPNSMNEVPQKYYFFYYGSRKGNDDYIDAVCPSNYYQWVALHVLSFTIEVSKVQNVLVVVVGYDPTLPTSNICQINLILFF